MIKIKNLDVKIIDELIKLENNVFGHIAENKEVVVDRIKTFREGCLGIFENKKLIGYTSSEIWVKYHKIKLNVLASLNHDKNGKILYVTSMAILPEYQRKGLGKRLLEKLIELAKEFKLKSVYLRTSKAKGFYEKNGFKFIRHVNNKDDSYDIMEFYI